MLAQGEIGWTTLKEIQTAMEIQRKNRYCDIDVDGLRKKSTFEVGLEEYLRF